MFDSFVFNRRWFAAACVALLLIVFAVRQPARVSAYSDQATVRLPDFSVTVDGQTIDNVQLTYPLIEYKDITYFPMTWDVGKGMGLHIDWSDAGGLHITSGRGDKTALRMEHNGHSSAGRNYTAQIVRFPVTVNGQPIDNASEPYPLLLFRDITYFPMTWRFAVEMFGWKTGWDDAEGFSITTWQRPYFQSIAYDDENYLYLPYFNGGGVMLRVRKDLTGTPEWLSEEEAASVRSGEIHENGTHGAGSDAFSTGQVELRDDVLYYEGVELVSLKPVVDADEAYYNEHPDERERATDNAGENKLFYYDTVMRYGNGNAFVSVTVYYRMHIPAPYTPRHVYSFIVKDGKAIRIDAMQQSVSGSAATEAGAWVWSYSPTYLSARNHGARGVVMHLNQDGSAITANERLNAQFVRVLSISGNDLIVQAYRMYGEPAEGENTGFFRFRSDGSFEKLADLVSMNAYVDSKGDLYVTDVNKIENITRGVSQTWRDHEIWNAPGPKPAH